MEEKDKKIITFSVEDIQVETLEDINESQFSRCRVKAFSSGMTTHGYTFTEDVLKSAESTILYKPLLWKYDMLREDAKGHEDDERICGMTPNAEDANITYEVDEETGKLFICFNAFIWKLYSGSLVDIFAKTDGLKKISVELWIIDSVPHPENNTIEVLKFAYTGITILGENVGEACKNAKMQITKFSDMTDVYEKEYLYSSIDFTIPKSIKNTVTFALELDENSNRKNKSIANYLFNSDEIDISKIKYIVNNYEKNTKDLESKSYWGDNECFDWCKKLLNSVNSIQASINIDNENKKEENMAKKVEDTKINTPELIVNSETPIVANSDEPVKLDNAEQYIHTTTTEEVDISLYDDKGNYLGSSSEYIRKSISKTEEIPEDVAKAAMIIETVLNSDDSDDDNEPDDDSKDDEEIDYQAKFSEMELKCSALEIEKNEFQDKCSILELKCSALETYKNNKENELKLQAVECAIDEVVDILSAEQLSEWRTKSVNCSDVSQFQNELKAFAFDIQKNSGSKPQDTLRNSIPKQTQVTSDNVWDRLASL